MGLSKTHFFTEKQNEISNVARALAHPARITILQHLATVPHCICNDLVIELPLAQATISQHLKELKQHGLIQGSIEGNSMCYCISGKGLDILQNFISDLIKTEENSHKTCCN